jgi:uncharacterized protein YprB with RNaseH-like and TPR domain
MSFKTRLSRLQGLQDDREKPPEGTESPLEQRLARIDRIRHRNSARMPPQEAVEARLARTLKGYPVSEGLIRIERRIPLLGTIGGYALSQLQQHPVLPGDGGLANHRQVYFDTETTGLSTGSGTLAFLSGFAVVEQRSLRVTQYLITRYGAESAMLEGVTSLLGIDDRLVSYNGKCYDIPLMNTRYRMADKQPLIDKLPHLDLLYPVRRLFGSGWPDCRLITLEKRLLGLTRNNDLPGSEAPAAWFDLLSTGNTVRLERVVAHNLQDILSLAMVHSVLTQVIEQPQRHGVDITALARWLVDHNATAAYTLLKRQPQALPLSGRWLLGKLARRFGDWELAVTTWEGLSRRGCRKATEQLAKYHEHISKDLENARLYCEQLPRDREQQRRLKRIVCKLDRQAMQPSVVNHSLPLLTPLPGDTAQDIGAEHQVLKSIQAAKLHTMDKVV